MCGGAPDIPTPVERQAVKLPQLPEADPANSAKRRKMMLAGLMTGPKGALGSPNVGKATLG